MSNPVKHNMIFLEGLSNSFSELFSGLPPSPSRVQVTYLIKNNSTLSFKCQFSRNDVKPSTYIVSWYTSSSSSKIYSQTLNSGDVSILPERSDNPFYQLGTSVSTFLFNTMLRLFCNLSVDKVVLLFLRRITGGSAFNKVVFCFRGVYQDFSNPHITCSI